MLGQEVMTSYVRSCSDEIGGFCDLSYLGEFRCFLECVFFFIAGSITGVHGYLGAIYSCLGVKVTQGHECHGLFP